MKSENPFSTSASDWLRKKVKEIKVNIQLFRALLSDNRYQSPGVKNMTNFNIDDIIRVNHAMARTWHMRQGVIRRFNPIGGTFEVELFSDSPKPEWVNLTASQMVKIVVDPTYARFRDHVLPELTKQSIEDYNDRQDKIAEEVNHDISVLRIGTNNGYIQGFHEGYARGYCDALEKTRSKPSDDNT